MYGLANLLLLLSTASKPRERLSRIRNRKLRRLIRHAYEEVPFYRDLMDQHQVHPDEVRSFASLGRLPVTRRETLQNASIEERTATVDLARCKRARTSGATGVPLEIVSLKRDRSMMNPSFLRVAMLWGLRPWHRLTFFEARPDSGAGSSWYERLGIFRRTSLSPSLEPTAWLEHLSRWKPFLLQGYSLTLKLLAEAARKEDFPLRIPLIISTSGVLDPYGRSLIAGAFKGSVVDVYASEEVGSVIAWECPHCSRYHLNDDTVVVEFLPSADRSLDGFSELLITNLTNFTMPFIRYLQGDLAVPAAALGCRFGFRSMKQILGRQADYIVLPSGKILNPHPFFRIMDYEIGVGRWKIVQTRIDELEIRFSLLDSQSGADFSSISRQIRELVGDEVRLLECAVPEIRSEGFQKLRSVTSQIPGFKT